MLFDEKIILTEVYATRIDFNKKKTVFVQGRPHHALTFRISGQVVVESEGKRLVSEKGSVTFVPAGFSYNTEIPEDGSMFCVHFNTDRNFEGLSPFVFYPTYAVSFSNMFSEICSRYRIGRENDLYCMSMFYGILAELKHEMGKANRSGILSPRLHKAKERIDFGFADTSLSVSSLAKEVGVSEVYFRKLFTASYGASPNAYIKKIRIENAKVLLRTGYYSVTETAIRCGFDSISYFSYVFHRYTGCTPTEYAARFS